MKILDIGCGKNKYNPENRDDQTVGLDKFKLEGVDVVHDLEQFPYPFSDDEFDMVIAYHSLEHVDRFFELMEEINRILKRGGKLKYGFHIFLRLALLQILIINDFLG